MRSEYLGILVVALFWGGYPLVARTADGTGHLGTLILALSGLVPVTAAVLWSGIAVRPSGGEITRMVIAGLMMGIGLVAFVAVSASKQLDASVSIPIMDTSMLIVTVIAAVVFLAEPMTLRKLIGLILLVAGILVLRPHE